MEVSLVDRRSQCDGIQMMERKLAEGMPIVELLYNEAKQIHFFAFHKSHIPDKMNEETEQKLSLVSAICGLAPVRGHTHRLERGGADRERDSLVNGSCSFSSAPLQLRSYAHIRTAKEHTSTYLDTLLNTYENIWSVLYRIHMEVLIYEE